MFINGCELVRADFHLHTRKDKEFKYTGEENSYVASYIEAMERQNICVGVITNHNKFDLQEYKALRMEGAKKEIFILPGVELSVKEGANGVHTLIVFNPDDWLCSGDNHIESFLTSAFYGIENRENENTRCQFDLPKTLAQLDSLGKEYFVIFAHIEQGSGFIKECAGGLIKSLSLKSGFQERVLGFQKLRTRDNIEKLKTWLGFEKAFVEGSDPKSIDEIGKGLQTFLKIGNYSYAAVKYALQDYQNRLFTERQTAHHGFITDISFTGGKLHGITVNFSPELNTLIGIRGSGKSSILEAIRYALDIDISSVDGNYKKELVKNVLGSGGQISMHMVDKFGKKYESKRIFGEKISILDDIGNDLAISVSSIINNPLYFGQKDLSFTQSGYELDLLEKLVGAKSSKIGVDMDSFETDLSDKLRKLSDVSAIPSQIKDLEDKNADLEHKLKVFEEKGVAIKLEKQTLCNSDIAKIEGISTKLSNLIVELRKALMTCTNEDLDLTTYVSKFNSETFKNANQITKNTVILINNVETSVDALELEKSNLATESKGLSDKVESLKEEFAEIKREIQDDTLDPDWFVQYTNEYDTNKKRIEDLRKLAASRSELIVQIKKCIRERNEALQKIFQAYQAEIEKINASQNELKIDITFKGNKNAFKEALKNNFKGTAISDGKYQQICDAFSDFVAIVEDYFINSGNILKPILSDGEYAKLGERIEENYGKLVAIECSNLVRIYYHGKLLEQHSIGQRASALILFILTQNDNDVIIIDQPEDDLDNQVIYKEVIHTIKAKKPDIQFLFATHNANIPVLGDAEQVIATSYSEDNKISVDAGNIDCPSSHKAIVDIMEGGKEAFDKRKLIYTTWE